jgi:hypothetical protein
MLHVDTDDRVGCARLFSHLFANDKKSNESVIGGRRLLDWLGWRASIDRCAMQSFTFVVAAMSNGDGPHHTARKGGAAAIGMQQRSDEAKKAALSLVEMGTTNLNVAKKCVDFLKAYADYTVLKKTTSNA